MILPLCVDDLQHDVALDAPQDLRRDQAFLSSYFLRTGGQSASVTSSAIPSSDRVDFHGVDPYVSATAFLMAS